uniref:Uncharacterized protein n=1 Tax=Neobodo designis TaxID=312471 RepID=A0A7S1QPL2_NEODS
MSANDISVVLGYAGKNGERDLGSVRDGKSKKMSVAEACAVLEAQLSGSAEPAGKPSSNGGAASAEAHSAPTAKADADRFDELVSALKHAKSMSDGDLSVILGYAGKNGQRDLAAVREGKSKKMPLAFACTLLEKELTPAAAAKPAAEKDAPAGTPPKSADASATQPDGNRFDALVATLKASKGMTDADVSVVLGYAGKNGERDLASVRAGKSKKMSTAEACAVLEKELAGGAKAAPKPAADDDGAATAEGTAPRWSEAPKKASSTDSGKSTTGAAPVSASPDRFDDLVAAYQKKSGASANDVSVMLGYAGKNGDRDLASVRNGKSKKMSLAEACALLDKKLAA